MIVGLLALGLLAGCDRQSAPPVQANAAATGGASAEEVQADPAAPPPATETIAKPNTSHAGEAPPAVTVADPAGKPVTIAALRGKPVLVNLWATWCAPCVAELPTLAALAQREGARLAVVTVSQDLDAAKARAFLGKRAPTLPAYTDPKLALSVAYAANLPTTVLYGADGKERWRVTGGMDWAGAEAARWIAQAR